MRFGRLRLLARLGSSVFLLMISVPAWSGVTVSGKIVNGETGESLAGVAVQIKGTTRGAATDVEGLFSLPDLPAQPMVLTLNALGYVPVEKPLTLTSGKDIHLKLSMEPEAIPLKPVEIVERSQFRMEREYSPQAATVNIESKELRAMPHVFEADLFRSLQVLPGVLPTSDFSADLNIWGGSSDQNLILLNGIDVYKPTHFGGLFSVFNMDAVKDVKLIKGGFGATYGGRLSAVVDVADREGNRKEFRGTAGLSLLASNLTLEGALPQGSWLLAGRRTYMDWATRTLMNNGVIDYDFPYFFYDLNLKLTRDFANGDRLTPSAYFGRDVLNLSSDTDVRIRMSWGNSIFSSPFAHVWHPKLYSTTTFAGSFYDSDFRFEASEEYFEVRNEIHDFTFRTEYSWFANLRHTVDFGLTAKALDAALYIGGRTYTWADRRMRGWYSAIHLADDYRVAESWTLTPGVRVERNEIAEANEVLPRLSVKKQLTGNSSISASWGAYSQYMQLASVGQNALSLFDSYVPLDNTLRPNKGFQYALSYEHRFKGGVKLATDVYYKQFSHLIEFKRSLTNPPNGDYSGRPLSDLFNEGEGEAYGFDVFLEGQWAAYTFMCGYGLGRSYRRFAAFDEGEMFPAHFDRLHNSNLVLTRKTGRRGTVEMRFNYGTGQPVTRATGKYDSGADLPALTVLPGHRNGHRLPDYQRLDVVYRLRYELKHWSVSPYVEVINLLDHKNVLSYAYKDGEVEEIGQLPLLPSIGATVEF